MRLGGGRIRYTATWTSAITGSFCWLHQQQAGAEPFLDPAQPSATPPDAPVSQQTRAGKTVAPKPTSGTLVNAPLLV